jgi:hypothetical protein
VEPFFVPLICTLRRSCTLLTLPGFNGTEKLTLFVYLSQRRPYLLLALLSKCLQFLFETCVERPTRSLLSFLLLGRFLPYRLSLSTNLLSLRLRNPSVMVVLTCWTGSLQTLRLSALTAAHFLKVGWTVAISVQELRISLNLICLTNCTPSNESGLFPVFPLYLLLCCSNAIKSFNFLSPEQHGGRCISHFQSNNSQQESKTEQLPSFRCLTETGDQNSIASAWALFSFDFRTNINHVYNNLTVSSLFRR